MNSRRFIMPGPADRHPTASNWHSEGRLRGGGCQIGVMCGRRPRVKGSFGCQLAVGCKSCVRPVCAAHMAAGPDV